MFSVGFAGLQKEKAFWLWQESVVLMTVSKQVIGELEDETGRKNELLNMKM